MNFLLYFFPSQINPILPEKEQENKNKAKQKKKKQKQP